MFRASRKARLGDLLVRRRLINTTQLEYALTLQQHSGQKLGQILVQQGWITQCQLKQTLSQQRLQHLTASVLLTCSTFLTTLPKVASAQTPTPNLYASLKTQAENAENNEDTESSQVALVSTWQKPNLQRPVEIDAIPLAQNPTETSPLIGFCHPLKGFGLLSQGFKGITHQGRMAYAMDYQVSLGTPVYAMRSGRVIGIEDRFADNGGGPDKVYEFNYILIEHEGGYRSAYLHLQQGFMREAGVKVGDYVSAGQLIGLSGNSGWSSGPHLHVEMQKRSADGTFGKTVPFKMGRSCQIPTVVATTQLKSAFVKTSSGASNRSLQSPTSQTTLASPVSSVADQDMPLLSPSEISASLVCTPDGCGCQACLNGELTGHNPQTGSIERGLSDRLPVGRSQQLLNQ